MTGTTTRRRLVADAAVTTLARAGLRGLTHRAVDQAAGLPAGSCSYYFRTRQALVRAAVERLVEVDTADLAAHSAILGDGGDPAEIAEIADAAVAIVRYWTTSARERLLARYELMLEAGRRPELQAVFDQARDHFRDLAERTLTAAGATAPAAQAELFVACLDGLVFRHLTGMDRLAARPAELRRVILDLLHGFTGPADSRS